MIHLKVDDASRFFFNSEEVLSAVNYSNRQVLRKYGGLVRKIARRSLRKARQKPVGQLTEEERTKLRIRQEIAKRTGKPQPARPLLPSKPGEPPRVITGLLKKFTYFVFDPATQSVLVGPVKLNQKSDGVPEALEYGGRSTNAKGEQIQIDARPWMTPANAIAMKQLPGMWANSVTQ